MRPAHSILHGLLEVVGYPPDRFAAAGTLADRRQEAEAAAEAGGQQFWMSVQWRKQRDR